MDVGEVSWHRSGDWAAAARNGSAHGPMRLLDPLPSLATIAADPSRLADVAPEQVPELMGACAALQAALQLRLQAGVPAAQPDPTTRKTNGSGPDRLLTASEAAERLGVSRRWMYRHQTQLPFAKKLSGGTLRFSERGLERWKDRRGG